MEGQPTLTKLREALKHSYVKHLADYLILRFERGDEVQVTILTRPFNKQIVDMVHNFDEELCDIHDPELRITKAGYTSKKWLTEVLQDFFD